MISTSSQSIHRRRHASELVAMVMMDESKSVDVDSCRTGAHQSIYVKPNRRLIPLSTTMAQPIVVAYTSTMTIATPASIKTVGDEASSVAPYDEVDCEQPSGGPAATRQHLLLPTFLEDDDHMSMTESPFFP
jgi:hypothetical protein